MRMRLSGIVAIAVLAVTPQLSQGQVTLGPILAYDNDIDFGIGVTLGAPLPSFGEEVGLMADFILFFPEGPGNYFEINGNVTYDFPLENSTVVPFVLAGLNLARVSGKSLGISFSDIQLGLNLGGGIEFDAGTWRPAVGARLEISGGEAWVLFASLPFELGG